MCGILGIVAQSPVNQLLYDGLLLLQHRGQDAAGIVTAEHNVFHMHKAPGMVRDVFRTRNMRDLGGNMGIAHCRYPTAGSAFKASEAQPFYVNSPFGIVLGHNGNLTNSEQLKEEMFRTDLRHINTGSDSEVLVNVLAHELEKASVKLHLEPQTIFTAVANVRRRLRVRDAPQHGREARREDPAALSASRDRRGDSDPRLQPPLRTAARHGARRTLPRGVREESLHRPHLHHAGAGGAQALGAPEAESDGYGIRGQERAPGRRLDRA